MIATQKAQSPGGAGPSAETKTDNRIICAAEKTGKRNLIEAAEFRDLRGRFAARGYCLQRVHRAGDGRLTFHVMRGEATRIFSHPHDLRAYLAQIEEVPRHGL